MNLRSRKIQEKRNEENGNVEEAPAQAKPKVAQQVSYDDIYSDPKNPASYSSNALRIT